MGAISRLFNFVTGGIIQASEINSEYNQLINLLSGNIDAVNLNTDSVTESKILAGAVTEPKIASSAITVAKIAANVITAAKIATGYQLVDDSVTADNLVYAATEGYVLIGAAAALIGEVISTPAEVDKFQVQPKSADGFQDDFYIPVVGLPIGAVITRLDIYGQTGAGINNKVEIDLKRANKDSSGFFPVADAAFSNGGNNDNDTAITNATVSKEFTYAILGAVTSDTAVTDAKFYSLRITYTTTNLGMR